MAKYVITGGNRLKGDIRISGNKNSVLPCLAACLLTSDEVVIKNVPAITDVEIFKQLLESVGSSLNQVGDEIRISTAKIVTTVLDDELTTRLRGSVLLAGALLGREGKAKFAHPGGDIIGKRSITETHLLGFRKMGFDVKVSDSHYEIKRGFKIDKNVSIFLEMPGVTGTENIILAAVLREGRVEIKNCAQEPHVVDLCHLLNLMGADIQGVGTNHLIVNGVSKLHGAQFNIGPDSTELGTYAVAAAITQGELTLTNLQNFDTDPIVWPMEKMGILFEKTDGKLRVKAKDLTAIPNLTTGYWPGFPTDMMSVMIVLATQARGVSLLRDWIYESRMFFVDKLISMGAEITIADPHRVLVHGPSKLFGRNLETPDIRAGMALVLAALIAKGTSTINRAELIERGYEDVVGNLERLGAQIERID